MKEKTFWPVNPSRTRVLCGVIKTALFLGTRTTGHDKDHPGEPNGPLEEEPRSSEEEFRRAIKRCRTRNPTTHRPTCC